MDYPETTPWTWADLAVYPRGSIFIRLVARESVKSMRAWVSQKIKNWRSPSIGLFTAEDSRRWIILAPYVVFILDCNTVRIFECSSTREQSNKRSATRLRTESETLTPRFTDFFTDFEKNPTVLQSIFIHDQSTCKGMYLSLAPGL